ncbi:MAG TPA: hypothetical protein VJQ56_02945, partial [Blastocatellia bacterium]|nr:hypothetical protein [Blastocatellia bacterium]
MFKQIHDRARAFNRRAGKAIVALPLALLMMLLAMPMTASCQRGHTDSERGISELRSLVASASGKPSASDLAAIESKHAGTRAS